MIAFIRKNGGIMKLSYLLVFLSVAFLIFDLPAPAQKKAAAAPGLAQLQAMASRFAPTPLRVDTSQLSSGDRQALVKLIEAGRVINDIFLKQYWSGNPALYAHLQKDPTPLGRARLHYFWINKCPWSVLDNFKPFLPGVPVEKPAGANFYPADMTKQEFTDWITSPPDKDPDKDKDAAKSFFTLIRWQQNGNGKNGQLTAIPYSEEYKDELTHAAGLLREAAALTENESLKKFLNLRADAFLSNDYYESDVAWMDLDAPLDVTIGPYETYDDELLGYKAAFEAFINLRDEEETRRVSAFTAHLQEIEDHLPIDPQYRNPKLGAGAPVRVVDEILAAGEGDRGVATTAYNLPNDDRVVQQKGSKRVMMRNVQEAKFRSVLLPIARRMLSKSAMVDVNFDSFFSHTVAHELMHGLGPHQITIQGRETNPRLELKELFSAIEEAKADVTGLFALQYWMDHASQMGLAKILPSDDAAQRQLYTTYLASMFRSLRFGLADAHGKGMAIQFNYLMDKGAFTEQADGTYALDVARFKQGVADLDHDLLTVEAEGDYAAARKMYDELGVIRPQLKKSFTRLESIPTDVDLVFVTAEELAPTVAPAPAKTTRKRKKHRG